MSGSSSQGIGTGGVIAIVLIVLKLCGVITWSWWWVLAPIWIGWLVVLLVVGLVFAWAWLVG